MLTSLSAEDRELIKSIQVFHDVEILDKLIADKKLRVEPLATGILTYHDSCYLGRHNGLIDAPRRVLDAVSSEVLQELGKNREHSFCCGAGGGLMWTEEKLGKRINHIRAQEVIDAGAKVVATSCPFCQTMLLDALKDKGQTEIQVKDVVQLVAEAAAKKNEPA